MGRFVTLADAIRRWPSGARALLAALCLVVGSAGAGAVAQEPAARQAFGPAPNFIGLPLDAAQPIAAASRLEAAVEYVASEAPPGTVVRQSPAAGAPITADAPLILYVSGPAPTAQIETEPELELQAAPAPAPALTPAPRTPAPRPAPAREAAAEPEAVMTPDITGLTPERAQALAGRIAAQIAIEEGPADADPGLIARQHPRAGAPLPDDGVIFALVSVGKLRAPDLVGQPLAVAEDTLADTPFLLAPPRYVDNTEPEGTIVGQMPPPGVPATSYQTGEGDGFYRLYDWPRPVLNVQVSRGGLIEMPDVIGVEDYRVKLEMEAQGFVVEIERVDSDARQTTVLKQDPQPGAALKKGDVIYLVSARVPPVDAPRPGAAAPEAAAKPIAPSTPPGRTPDLIGIDYNAWALASASALNEGDWFIFPVMERGDPSREGTVLDQSPKPGEPLPADGAVLAVLSAGPGFAVSDRATPSFIGMSEVEAIERGESLGIPVVAVYENEEEVGYYAEIAKITRQLPNPGEPLGLGGDVMVIGVGDEVFVPGDGAADAGAEEGALSPDEEFADEPRSEPAPQAGAIADDQGAGQDRPLDEAAGEGEAAEPAPANRRFEEVMRETQTETPPEPSGAVLGMSRDDLPEPLRTLPGWAFAAAAGLVGLLIVLPIVGGLLRTGSGRAAKQAPAQAPVEASFTVRPVTDLGAAEAGPEGAAGMRFSARATIDPGEVAFEAASSPLDGFEEPGV